MKVVVSALIAVHKGTTLNGLKNALISLASQDYKKMEITAYKSKFILN